MVFLKFGISSPEKSSLSSPNFEPKVRANPMYNTIWIKNLKSPIPKMKRLKLTKTKTNPYDNDPDYEIYNVEMIPLKKNSILTRSIVDSILTPTHQDFFHNLNSLFYHFGLFKIKNRNDQLHDESNQLTIQTLR